MGDDARTAFWSTVLSLLRRKRVVVPAVLVGLALGCAAFSLTPPTYVSSTTMVLTTTEFGGTESQDPTKPTDLTNPMLNFNESLRTTSAILIEAMNTKSVADELRLGGSTRLRVNDGRTNPDLLGLNGPFLYIVAMSTDADEAARVVADAQAMMRQKLSDWQHALNAPQKTFVSLVDVVPPNAPERDRGRGTKLGLVGFLLGLLLCLGVAYLLERRARRRTPVAAVVAEPVAAAPVVVEVDEEPSLLSPAPAKPGAVDAAAPLQKHTAVRAPSKKAALAVVAVPVKQKARARSR